jgi:hypothetical protein
VLIPAITTRKADSISVMLKIIFVNFIALATSLGFLPKACQYFVSKKCRKSSYALLRPDKRVFPVPKTRQKPKANHQE